MPPSVVENLIVGFATSIITAIGVWIWNKIRHSRIINRKTTFFGVSIKDKCLVVMNRNPNNLNTMSHEDVQTLLEVVKLAEGIGVELEVAPFDEILEPAGVMTEFCLGGPDSNQRTKIHLANFLKGVRFNPYTPSHPDNIAIVTPNGTFQYEKNHNEYAILARIYPDPKAHPIILISGQTARSNQGAIHYLIENYDQFLREKFGTRKQFCLLLRLQSPLVYGYKSSRLERDMTDTAFLPFP